MAEEEKWMQKARDAMKRKGTVGKFSAKAKAQGKTTAELASEDYSKPGTLGKEARFAYTMEHRK